MRKIAFAITLLLSVLIAVPAMGNSVGSSVMEFEGTLTDAGGGVYTGTIDAVEGSWYVVGGGGEAISTAGGFDVYAEAGGCALVEGYYGTGAWNCDGVDTYTIGWNSYDLHDAYPDSFGSNPPWGPYWNPDVPDYDNYELVLTADSWALRYKGTAQGTPMSGVMLWGDGYAVETDVGSYTGTVPADPDANDGGAAAHGAGAGWWDMDWTWGSDAIPLELAGFDVTIDDLGSGTYHVTFTPEALTEVWVDDDYTPATPGWGGTHFATIQDAVDIIDSGTVHVAEGEYVEQVHISKDDVDIVGAGVGLTVIKSPVTLPLYFATGADNYPVVFVDGATGVDLSNLTIDGDFQGDTNYRFIGLGFWNAGGSLVDAEVLNVMNSAFSGAQHGVGVYAYNDTGGPYTIVMTDVVVDDYQKTAVALMGDGLTVDLTRVDTYGQGGTDVTAQNGIQIGYGTGGTVTDCEVYDNYWTGDTWTASGILVFDMAHVDVSGAYCDGNQTSAYFESGTATFDGSTIVNPTGDALYVWGIGVKGAKGGDRPVSSPFDGDLPRLGGRAAASVSCDGSIFTGADAVDSWGPSCLGYSSGVAELTLVDCEVSNWDYGVVNYEYDPADDATTTMSGCSLVDNMTYAYYSNSEEEQDVELNWWGDPDGPTSDKAGGAVSGVLSFSPWFAAPPGTSPMPIGTNSSIQDAIDIASAGATITVSAGTYDEMLNVNKSLTLRGANWGVHPAVGMHPTEVVGTRTTETILSHNGLYALKPSADDITVDGFMFTGDGGRIIDTYDDADNFHLTNCIFDNDAAYASQGVIQFGGGSHTGMLIDFNLFETGEIPLLYTGGGPWDGLTIEYNLLNLEGDAVFWTGTELVDGVIRGNEIDGTVDGVPGTGFCTFNIGKAGNLLVEDNWIHDVFYTPFQVGIIGGDVLNNVFERIYPYPTYNGDCFQLWGGQWGTSVSDDVEFVGNRFYINDAPGITEPTHGIRLRGPEAPDPGIDGTTIVCRDNLFIDGGSAAGALAIRHQGDTTMWVDAEMNWWGDGTGPYHATLNPSGLGIESGDYVDFDPWILGNIYCDPDPEYLDVAGPTKTVAVKYLGGGGGAMFGYNISIKWDGSVVSTTTGDFSEGNLLSDLGGTFFFAADGTGDEIIVDCALLGSITGATAPGTLFTIDFTGTAVGTSPVDITILNVRDQYNNPLGGFSPLDGTLIIDVVAPVITDVEIFNDTLGHTDDHIKDGDAARVTATVVDDDPAFGAGDIVADLTDLGGGAAVNPVSYLGNVATWNIASVTCTPADGIAWVYVDATDAIGNPAAQGSDDIITDNTLPTAVTAFDAAPGHQKCDLSWTMGTDTYLDGVVIQRTDNTGDYPLYVAFKGAWPTVDPFYAGDHTLGTNVYSGGGGTAVDAVVDRNIYYYQAFCYDIARNYGLAASTARDLATNYWLGDVAAAMGFWGYNGFVNDADIDKLGGSYHMPPPGSPEDEMDVGPTVHPNYGRLGLPFPDTFVGFEDLMIFAMNYGVVAPRVVPLLSEPAAGDLALALEEVGTDAEFVELALRLEGNVDEVKGVSAVFELEGLELVSARLSDEMNTPAARTFLWAGDGQIDLAILGTGVSIGGSGELARLTFQVTGEGCAVDFASATLRGVENGTMDADLEGYDPMGDIPATFRLVQNTPNPFNPMTTIAFSVPHESQVAIRVYDVSGRVVRTLVDGVTEPGRHAAVWDGRNDHGESCGSGVYFCVMETPEFRGSSKMMLLK